MGMTYGLFRFCTGVVDYQHTNSRRLFMATQSTTAPTHRNAKPNPSPQPQTRNLGTSYGRSSGYARSSSYQRDFSGFKYL